MLAKNALNPIEKKLKGIYSTSKERQEKEITTSNLVQMLIQEATDPSNLVSVSNTIVVTNLTACSQAKMYPGWAAWH
jgi:serine/threonine-protein kinase ATR